MSSRRRFGGFGAGGRLLLASMFVGWVASAGACGGKVICTDSDGRCDAPLGSGASNQGSGAGYGNGANGSGANGQGANGQGANGNGANGSGANGQGANGQGADGSGAMNGAGGYVSTGGSIGIGGDFSGTGGYSMGAAGGRPWGQGGSGISTGGSANLPQACMQTTYSTQDRSITNFEDWTSPQSIFVNGDNLLGGAFFYDSFGIAYPLLVPGHNDASVQALAIEAASFTAWAGEGLWFFTCVDATQWRGLTFWARGQGTQIELQVGNVDTMDVADGGNCTGGGGAQCFNPAWHFKAKKTWTQYTVSWDQFSPGYNNGKEIPINPAQIAGLNFAWINQTGQGDFKFALDDIGFIGN